MPYSFFLHPLQIEIAMVDINAVKQ